MSGGFFRGTSADQDTRFSNKQLKLLKSQKFAPELEHLVDMTKVNMEVMKPWITRRVTELLGFEDEVLINFIHSLLDAKEVNGKEIQIQLTGFMEKNTGKFMKELWTLLLSAQKNASGVPQQFLDAKEEELRKKKVENDKITSEIQRKREKEDREFMEVRLKKLDGGFDAKDNDTALDSTTGHYVQDGKESDKRNGVRGRSRVSRSPRSPAVSVSPNRGSPSRSMSKSFSNSRSYSGGRHRSRSISRSPEARRRSPSSDRIRRSPRRRSISPRRYSPRRSPYRRPPYSRRRSRSRSTYRSPSPLRRRMHSPYRRSSPSYRRRRSPSPVKRRRSPSPMRRRRSPSPIRRRRSPSPVRRRRSPSPVRRQRSPSPLRRRSPIMRYRSPPVRRMPPTHLRSRSGSPMQSTSPIRRRDGSQSPQRRSPSPLRRRSPGFVKRRSPSPSPRRSPPNEWSSQSPARHVSTSPVKRTSSRRQRSPVQPSRGRVRTPEELSPVAHQHPKDKDHKASRTKSPDSVSSGEKSPPRSVSPQPRRRNSSEDRSPPKSPVRQRRDKLTHERSLSPPKRPRTQKPRHDSPETSEDAEGTYHSRDNRDPNSKSSGKRTKYLSPVSKRKNSPAKFHDEADFSPEMAAGRVSSGSRHYDNTDGSRKGREIKGDISSGKGDESYVRPKSPRNKESYSSEKPHESYAVDTKKSDDKDHSLSNYAKNSDRRNKSEATRDLVGKVDRVNHSASYDSVSEESDKHRREGKEKRKHRKSEKKVVSSDEDYSSDSEMEDRKDAKRRKKEEKKLRKEEKRRRREEKRRRREERRAEKLKMKGKTDYSSDDEEAERMDHRRSDNDEMLSEQKKLEIELRNKALESLKAKKAEMDK
ncbi:hypothetical protein AAHE18_13G047800 [Arachis hypogaea]|nr:Serine/arginine repetitive matrix protein [Arachis hypogaea]